MGASRAWALLLIDLRVWTPLFDFPVCCFAGFAARLQCGCVLCAGIICGFSRVRSCCLNFLCTVLLFLLCDCSVGAFPARALFVDSVARVLLFDFQVCCFAGSL